MRYDDLPPIPRHLLGPLDRASGLVGRSLPALPLSVLDHGQLARRDRLLEPPIGDRGQTRGAPGASHLPGSLNAASVPSAALTEQIVISYSRRGDLILDPFAGGPTRAVVAALLGRRYVGVDIREEQVAATNARLRDLGLDHLAVVHHANAAEYSWRDAGIGHLVLTCPPYWNLEVYSDDPRDLSTCETYEIFIERLGIVVARLSEVLAADAFAAWIVGRIVHPKTGELLSLPDHVEALHRGSGFRAWDRIEVPFGTAGVPRIGQFRTNRRTVNAHESVVVTRRSADD